MASEAIMRWLRVRRRNAVIASGLYFLFAIACGALIPIPIFLALYRFGGAWLCVAGFIVMVLIYADCVYAQRDDLSFIPKWMIREVLHAIPRLALDGARHLVRASRMARMDLPLCADVLTYLVNKRISAAREELLAAFPGLDWARLLVDLRLIEGVLFLRRDHSRVGLTSVLRLELEMLWMRAPKLRSAEPDPEPEPEPGPVGKAEPLSPSEILGVSDGASLVEIKAAYRSRVKECHPDKFASLDEHSRGMAEEWTKSLNAAYESLMAESAERRR